MGALTVHTHEVADPGDLLAYLPVDRGVAWVRHGDGLVGWGEAVRVEPGPGEDRIARLVDAYADLSASADVDDEVGLPGCGLVAFVSATFDARSHSTVLLVPQVLVGRRDDRAWVTTVDGADPDLTPQSLPDELADRVRYAGSSKPDVQWLEAVATAVARIAAGDVQKVVLARDHAVWSRAPFDPRRLARRLAARFPDCATFLVDGLIGATPEVLVHRERRDVRATVLAGSARRERDADADAAVGAALLASDKDRAEHAFALSSVRAALERHCHELHVDGEPSLLLLANVQHLATQVRGTLVDDVTALELADLLHPTAAVGGVPSDIAIAMIRELEGMDRGRYAGPVGWVDARGDGEFGIALRCAELAGARARMFAGAGIVAGSLPEDELEETRLKLRAMRHAFDA